MVKNYKKCYFISRQRGSSKGKKFDKQYRKKDAYNYVLDMYIYPNFGDKNNNTFLNTC